MLEPLEILPFDQVSAQFAASVRAELERHGNPIGPHDLLIAATVLRYGATPITRNVREFCRVSGLKIVNWHEED